MMALINNEKVSIKRKNSWMNIWGIKTADCF